MGNVRIRGVWRARYRIRTCTASSVADIQGGVDPVSETMPRNRIIGQRPPTSVPALGVRVRHPANKGCVQMCTLACAYRGQG